MIKYDKQALVKIFYESANHQVTKTLSPFLKIM